MEGMTKIATLHNPWAKNPPNLDLHTRLRCLTHFFEFFLGSCPAVGVLLKKKGPPVLGRLEFMYTDHGRIPAKPRAEAHKAPLGPGDALPTLRKLVSQVLS